MELLCEHGITAVADVRSQPYSRFSPQFNRETLKGALHNAGISYVFLGRELGARSDDAECYQDGKVDYSRIAQTALFQSGLDRVEGGAEAYHLSLLCAEKEPLDCHRTILVSRHLVDRGLRVRHILADGTVEEHADTIARLLRQTGLPDSDLFRSREMLEAEAYDLQGARIAYQRPEETSRPAGHVEDL